jgi:hypothetical protein
MYVLIPGRVCADIPTQLGAMLVYGGAHNYAHPTHTPIIASLQLKPL